MRPKSEPVYRRSPADKTKGGFYQYSHVLKPEVFEWGFNRGNPSQFRGQFLEQIGATFKSAVSQIMKCQRKI